MVTIQCSLCERRQQNRVSSSELSNTDVCCLFAHLNIETIHDVLYAYLFVMSVLSRKASCFYSRSCGISENTTASEGVSFFITLFLRIPSLIAPALSATRRLA
jgi:hypothetical protein